MVKFFKKILIGIRGELKRVHMAWWLLAVVALVAFLPFLFGQEFLKEWKDASETARNFGIGLAGLFAATYGVYLAWVRTQAAADQAKTAETKEIREAQDQREFLYTQLFSRAIEQLGNDSLSIRVGGIYALERLAKDSKKDHRPIMEVLSSFIRENTKIPKKADLKSQLEGNIKQVPARRADIQAALTVIGRRNLEHEEANDSIDLNMTNLHGALLQGMNFSHVVFFRAVLCEVALQEAALEFANFTKADLRKARMQSANLQGAILAKSDLSNAKLSSANLEAADLRKANLDGADLHDTNLRCAILIGANLAGANLSSSDLRNARLEDATIGSTYALDLDAKSLQLHLQYSKMPNLKGADFSGAKGLTVEQMALTVYDDTTKLPEGFDIESLNRIRRELASKLSEEIAGDEGPFDLPPFTL